MEERIYPLDVIPEETHSPARPPEAVLQEAQRAAKALEKVVAGKKKPVIFRGEQYLEFEDWQTVAKFYGLCARTLEAEPVEIFGVKGARARAEVVDLRTGQVVGGAEAYCMRDEENWQGKPWFQLASMAQTRAGAKALRNVLAWVVVLAGYRPTPAEEIQESAEYRKAREGPSGKGGRSSQGGASSPLGSTAQRSVNSQAGASPQAGINSQSHAPVSGAPLLPAQGGNGLKESSPEGSKPQSSDNGETVSGDPPKPDPLGERPTREEIQNLLRLAYKNGFSTVNAEGKKCVDYHHLGEFLKSNGFPRMIREMSRKQCQMAALFLETRARTLFSQERENESPQ